MQGASEISNSDPVVIVGGGPAGLSSGVCLARSGVHVVVVDAYAPASSQEEDIERCVEHCAAAAAGRSEVGPRNRFAQHAHNHLGLDGATPGSILRASRSQFLSYAPFATLLRGLVVGITKTNNAFRVELEDGSHLTAVRVILACGMVDELPSVENIWSYWGGSVASCPHCHGQFELPQGDVSIGLLYSPHLVEPSLSAFLSMVSGVSANCILFTQGLDVPSSAIAMANRLAVRVVEEPIISLDGDLATRNISGAVLKSGAKIPLKFLYVTPTCSFGRNEAMIKSLGLETVNGPHGPFLKVGSTHETSCSGVSAAGDCAFPIPQISIASSEGLLTGVFIHISLAVSKGMN